MKELKLNKETLRKLAEEILADVHGGRPAATEGPPCMTPGDPVVGNEGDPGDAGDGLG